jgi:hypothetical protein
LFNKEIPAYKAMASFNPPGIPLINSITFVAVLTAPIIILLLAKPCTNPSQEVFILVKAASIPCA